MLLLVAVFIKLVLTNHVRDLTNITLITTNEQSEPQQTCHSNLYFAVCM